VADSILVIHRQTRVETVFSVCDQDGNLLFDYPVQGGTQRFSEDDWATLRRELERAQELLRAGVITGPGQPLPAAGEDMAHE
jgi:hypothetical protein